MPCPRCGYAVSETARFCPQCSTPIQQSSTPTGEAAGAAAGYSAQAPSQPAWSVPQQAIPDIPSPVQQLFQEPQAPALPPDVQPVVLVYQLKDPGWAAVFSFFLHGLGFVYLGNFGWFIIWCLIDIVIILLYFVLIGMFIYPIASIVASIMAYNQAEKWNNKQRAVYMQKRVAPHA